MRRRLCDLRQPRAGGFDGRQWPVDLGGQRQFAERRRPERGADRRIARPAPSQEGGLSARLGQGDAPGILYVSYDGMLEPLGQSQVVAYLEKLAPGRRIHLISFEKSRDWQDKARRQAMRERLAQAGIAWHPLRYHKA